MQGGKEESSLLLERGLEAEMHFRVRLREAREESGEAIEAIEAMEGRCL